MNKSNTLKNYLQDIGSKNQIFFLFGNTTNVVSSNTPESGIDVWKNSELSYRVARRDSVAVIPNITWASGNVYKSWSSKTTNSGSYYAWNKINGIVYLCVSNNSLNRTDLSMSNVSNQIPTHTNGLQTYLDGYTWLPLYKITSDLLRFVNSSWIPVISFDDYRITDVSKYTSANTFCNNNQSSTVYCGVYFKETSEIETSSGTFTTYSKGKLYETLRIACQKCYYLFENDDRYEAVSYLKSTDVASTIQIKDKFDIISDLVLSNQISTSSPYYSLYTISANGLADGAIVSAHIDISDFVQSDLVVDTKNPEITLTSETGTGASIIFTTYVNIDGENIINGVALVSSGSGYKDINLSIDYAKFPYLTSTQVDALLASIDVNIDILDGLNFDPVSALGAENIMFDIRLETNILKQQNTTIPSEINFYGLVENPIELLANDVEIVAGSQYGKDDSYVEKHTAKLKLSGSISVATPPTTIDGTLSNGNILSDIKVSSLDTTGAYPTIELFGLNYKDIDNISTLTIDSTVYSVTEILEKPIFKQYSGKVSQTKKLTNSLKLGNQDTNTENTKLFRINIVKGF